MHETSEFCLFFDVLNEVNTGQACKDKNDLWYSINSSVMEAYDKTNYRNIRSF